MKRKNLIKLLVDTIYRDNIYLITPNNRLGFNGYSE